MTEISWKKLQSYYFHCGPLENDIVSLIQKKTSKEN